MNDEYSNVPSPVFDESENFFNNVKPKRITMEGSDISTSNKVREVDVYGPIHLINSFSELTLQLLSDSDFEFGIQTENETVPLYHNTAVINSVYRKGMDELSDQEYLQKIYQLKTPVVNDMITRIYKIGYQRPTSVQTHCIIPVIQGRDAIIQSPAGTGKTATMIIGSLYNFDVEDPSLQLIVLTSTHEIALQIYEKAVKLLAPEKAKIALCIGRGGGGQNTQTNISTDPRTERKEAENAQILVCTLGKLYGYMCETQIAGGQTRKPCLKLKNLKTFCMDEFDTILCPKEKNSSTAMNSKLHVEQVLMNLPPRAQRIFFSATTDRNEEAVRKASNFFRPYDPQRGEHFAMLQLKDNVTIPSIKQYYVAITRNMNNPVSKIDLDVKLDVLVDLISTLRIAQCIIFVNSIEMGKHLYQALQYTLQKSNIKITPVFVHGSLHAEEREHIFRDFQSGSIRYLISTDLNARGIDVHAVNLVVNYDMPQLIPDGVSTYIHRIGRAGRVGKVGTAISFIYQGDVNTYINEISKSSAQNRLEPLPSNGLADLLG